MLWFTWVDRVLNVLLAVATVTVVAWMAPAVRAHAPAPPSLAIGDTVRGAIVQRDGHVRPLLDVYPHTCRYVVFYAPTCPASTALAHQWHQTFVLDPHILPENWRAIWVSTESAAPSATHPFVLPARTESAYSVNSGYWSRAVGVTGVPFHVVLDRDGRLISTGTGGHLLPRDAYTSDCSLDTPY